MRVMIVYGPPAAGKTTYVRDHKKQDDLVIDFDLIKQAITMHSKAEAIGELYEVCEGIREYLYSRIEKRDVCTDVAWVIASLPSYGERMQLKERLKADLVLINPGMEECIKRAMQDKERGDKDLQIQIIDRWYKNYEATGVWVPEQW